MDAISLDLVEWRRCDVIPTTGSQSEVVFQLEPEKRSKLQVNQVNRAALGSLSQKLATSVSILFSRVAMEIASKAFLGCANRFRLDRGNRSVFLDSDSFISQTVKKKTTFLLRQQTFRHATTVLHKGEPHVFYKMSLETNGTKLGKTR